MIIDLSNIRTIDTLHDQLKMELKFPAFYGNNWDALWDVLTHSPELPQDITLLGYAQFGSRFPAEAKSFSKLISDYNDHCFRYGKRGRIDIA